MSEYEKIEIDTPPRISWGDPQAFERLFNDYYAPIFSFFKRRGVPHANAEDLAQDVFVNVWKKRAQLDEGKSIRGYLYTAAYNTLKMHFRSKSTRDAHMQKLAIEQQDLVLNAKDEFDVNEHINKALNSLPEYQKVVFVMHRYDGLSYKEIAQVLDLSVKTIESRMSKALKALRVALRHLLFWVVAIFT